MQELQVAANAQTIGPALVLCGLEFGRFEHAWSMGLIGQADHYLLTLKGWQIAGIGGVLGVSPLRFPECLHGLMCIVWPHQC